MMRRPGKRPPRGGGGTGRASTQAHLSWGAGRPQKRDSGCTWSGGRAGGGEPVAATPLFQLAGSPSLKTVSLTFSIQVSRLKCRYEQFFLPQHSQTWGRGVGANPPALLFLPRQKRKGGGPTGPKMQTGRSSSGPRQTLSIQFHPLGQPSFCRPECLPRGPWLPDPWDCKTTLWSPKPPLGVLCGNSTPCPPGCRTPQLLPP